MAMLVSFYVAYDVWSRQLLTFKYTYQVMPNTKYIKFLVQVAEAIGNGIVTLLVLGTQMLFKNKS